MKIENVYIVEGKRTAVTNFCGSFSKTPAHILTKKLIEYLITNNNLDKNSIDEVILGQVLTAGCGQNPARQASIGAGINVNTNAWTINQMCASGMKSIMIGAHSIMLGTNSIVIAGGQENMSIAPHASTLRNPSRMGNINIKDLMLLDGLTDAFGNYHMGITAENLAKKYNISRIEQDEFSYNSHMKASAAIEQFKKEILPVEVETKKGLETIQKDEFIKPDTNMDILKSLKSAFTANGTITAGNAAGINDGAACVLLASKDACSKHNLKPIAKIVSTAQSGIDPSLMGIAPINAIYNALKSANWTMDNLDFIEINEAFAAQILSIVKEMKINQKKLNPNGGAIAIGHPIGASGARCTVTALNELITKKLNKCIVSLCAGGGMGTAICIERLK